MSIATEIQRIKANIENAYTKAEGKGATIPTNKNSENLASTIESIETGGTVSTQEKTATPTKDTQNITPDSGYYLSKVVVNPIPDEYIVPSGSQSITENGTYDITDKAQVVVNVESSGSGESTLKKLLDYTKSCHYMFYETKITDLTGYIDFNDTSNVTDMSFMFAVSNSLTTIPQLNTSNVTTMSSMFNSCSKFATMPQSDTSKVTDMYYMFRNCTSLTTVLSLDMRSVTNAGYMFVGCKALTNLTLLNIPLNLQVGSGTSWGHLLTLESLIGLCQQCINVNASRTLTVGTANMTKLADVYVKFTDSSQTTIDVNAKGENMVQCESTDTGAMTISDYMGLKNWVLA